MTLKKHALTSHTVSHQVIILILNHDFNNDCMGDYSDYVLLPFSLQYLTSLTRNAAGTSDMCTSQG